MKFLVVFCTLATVAFARSTLHESDETKRLALENPDLYDGDIVGIDGPFDIEDRNGIAGKKYRWPRATVPYVIDDSLSDNTDTIIGAMANYQDNTCVKFVERTNEKDYIRIFHGKGCNSNVGRTGGEQRVSLGKGCMYVGTVIHELGHALGFYHEHKRSDRDDYIFVYLENVLEGEAHNFNKLSPKQNILYNAFDYNSIMIYSNTAFSKNGKSTMVAKNGEKLIDAFTKESMSDSDIYRVNTMYDCPPDE